MDDRLPHLMQPLDLGPFTLRNRVICTGHNPHYGADGLIGDQQIAFHARKAQGGIALSTTGGTSVHPSGGLLPLSPLINFDDSVLPGYGRLADAMHSHGSRMLVQLGHAASAGASHHSGHALWAPSQVMGVYGRELPHVMTTAEIHEVVDAFGAAAGRVARSGLDGVELSLFAGGLAQQFMSPVTNRRTDAYGGSLGNRLRFVLETIEACRAALGPEQVVAIKLAGDELYEEGLHVADMQEIVRQIDAAARVDYYVVAVGTNLEQFPRVDHWPPSPAPHGLYTGLAARIKSITARPVAALCRIVDPRMADRLVADGTCDLVAVVRATFADPDFVAKAAAGRFEDIRKCVGANSGCVDRIQLGEEARCIYNPVTGREVAWGAMDRAVKPRRVAVVGGGPGGLEAARVAAERGHHVVLFERSGRLGGAALVVGRKPGRSELLGIPEWLSGQVRRLGVDVRLETEATVEAVLAEAVTAVIVATGSSDTAPAAAASGMPVASAWSVLAGEVEPGRKVVVVDHMGGDVGCAVAELVLDRGGSAEVVSRHAHPALDAGLTNTVSLYRRLFRKGVTLTPHHDLESVDGTDVVLRNVYGGPSRSVREVDMLVVATPPLPNDGLVEPFSRTGLEVHVIGDCVAPRDIETAVFEGHRAARAL
jgi:2,4-dienoyl-CoA reductase (NADPH2)